MLGLTGVTVELAQLRAQIDYTGLECQDFPKKLTHPSENFKENLNELSAMGDNGK
ncbi:hypothetical protein J6590_009364, partial [Homalodisca vitripennis]